MVGFALSNLQTIGADDVGEHDALNTITYMLSFVAVHASTCSCLTTSDCNQSRATCFLGSCQNIGNPCTSNADCAIQCTMIDNGSGTPVGICETQAKACGKGEGMTCDQLENEAADCHNY